VTGGDWEIWCENYELDMLIYKHNKAWSLLSYGIQHYVFW
jgi:hypothetical protein